MCALICVLLCCVVIAGCYHPRGGVWAYRASSYPMPREGTINQTMVVLPFQDSRPYGNTRELFDLRWPIPMIPLIPNGTADYARPEAPDVPKLERYFYEIMTNQALPTSQWQFNPAQDFAQATTEELTASGLFKKVVLAVHPAEEDVILRVELKSTRYRAKVLRYGLGIIGMVLFFHGAPMASVENELDVEFVLEERVTGKLLWRKSYHTTKDGTFFFYWSPPDFYYDVLFKTILQDVVKNLQTTLATKKGVFPPNWIPAAISLLPHSQSTARDEAGVPPADGILADRQWLQPASWETQ